MSKMRRRGFLRGLFGVAVGASCNAAGPLCPRGPQEIKEINDNRTTKT